MGLFPEECPIVLAATGGISGCHAGMVHVGVMLGLVVEGCDELLTNSFYCSSLYAQTYSGEG